jgi:hypothetical protein
MASIVARLQAVGLEVSTDTVDDIPVTVAKGTELRKVDSKTTAAFTAARILAAVSGNIGPAIALGAPGAARVFYSVVIAFSESVTQQSVEHFSARAYAYSDQWKKGTHSKGIACIPVLLTDNAPDDAKTWVRTKPQSHYQVALIPVIIDLVKGEFAYLEKIPFQMRLFFIPGLQLVESCIRTPPQHPD